MAVAIPMGMEMVGEILKGYGHITELSKHMDMREELGMIVECYKKGQDGKPFLKY